jgi:hypothetical protein
MKARCFSFANVTQVPGLPYYVPGAVTALDACIEHKIPIMMDSGVVGWRSYGVSCTRKGNVKALAKLCGEDEFIQLYVDYVKANYKKWAIYITIDLERVAAGIFERHKKIRAMGITPVPVFHGDDDAGEFIRKYADLGHKLVAIASWRTLRFGREQFGTYLNAVFHAAEKCGVGLHGLAMTAPWMMMGFPWQSVDSSSWSRVAGFGGIMKFDLQKHRLTNMNISDRATSTTNYLKLNSAALQAIREEVESDGFNFDTLRTDFVQRHIYNARTMHLLTEYASKKHGNSTWNLLF